MVDQQSRGKFFSEDEVSIPNINRRSAELSQQIDQFDVRNLLSEDLERSRKILIGLTALSLLVNIVNITSFKLFGIEASLEDYQRVLLSLFIFCVSLLAARYYQINFHTDLLAKRVKSELLTQSIEQERAYLKHAARVIERAAGTEGADTARNLVESNIRVLEMTRDEFERQYNSIVLFPKIVAISCLAFQVAGMLLGSN